MNVIDNGVGMTTDQIQKLFGAGVQFNVNNLQDGNGSGLGLYISKGILEQHGGSLVAESGGIGHGSSFTATLPLHRVPNEALPRHLDHLQVGIPSKSSRNGSEMNVSNPRILFDKPLSILVVDDSELNRKILVKLLRRRGHQCHEACNGLAGVEQVRLAIAEERAFDVILMVRSNGLPIVFPKR